MKLHAPQTERSNTRNKDFCKIYNVKAPYTNLKPPIEEFLVAVLGVTTTPH